MATIDTVATWCTTTMLKRSDLTAEARLLALEVYLLVCHKIPFEALQRKSAELALIAGTDSYDLLGTGPTQLVPSAAGLMSVRYTAAGGTRKWRLKRSHTRLYDAVAYTSSNDSRTYARFGNSIELNPAPPSSSATMRIRYWTNPTIDATPHNTVLLIPDAWHALLQWETLYRLYFITGQEDKAGQLIMPMPMPRQLQPKRTQMFEVGIIPRLWNDLLGTINMKEAVDEDFGVNPISRPYTSA